jgi:hypothetical protein
VLEARDGRAGTRHVESSFVSDLPQAFSNRSSAACASARFLCISSARASPHSDHPFSGQRAESSRYTFSASSTRPARSSTAPSEWRTGCSQSGGSS